MMFPTSISRYRHTKEKPFRLENMLTNEVEIIQWASDGLPSDELLID
jgi:hypothetical protein